MREDFERRKRVKRWTNFIAITALVDVLITLPLSVIALRAQQLTHISTLVACIQISCHEFLIMITSWILLRCGRNHFERIDAAGAWMIVHFVTLIGNVCLLIFEAWPGYGDLENTSLFVRLLLGWKLFFIIVEVVGMIYCYYIIHNPITYLRTNSSSQNQTQSPSTLNVPSGSEERVTSSVPCTNNRHDLIEQGRSNGRNNMTTHNANYERKDTDPPPYTLNPAFESELSLEYANNYSPYDQMMTTGRNRLSYPDQRYGSIERL